MTHQLLLEPMPMARSTPRTDAIAWNQLAPDSLMYSYFAHLFYDGSDLLIEQEEACMFVHEFVAQVARQGGPMEDVDLHEGIAALTRPDGRISMGRLVEELCLLLV
ncbi:hypothetical protein ACHHYP_17444 [Achlya hypogyna]|uniref:Uncharacterized protein n=1 Tax=Achlya hypogyna TaxID=1202772 RepID=A0A1V9Y4I8_ACHHY|nr:hypothetical protein ACHHYP_17444 [Achlya hypogyna]